jgi:serine/threonine protein kinase
MQSVFETTVASPRSTAWNELEDCIAALERDWAEGAPGRLEEYLPPGSSYFHRTALVELVKVDLELRWKAGMRTSLDDYCALYPELGTLSELPAHLVYEAYHVARRHRACTSAAEFCRRFPGQRSTVLRLARLEEMTSTVVSSDASPSEMTVGTQLGDFEILGLLGEGSFSKVFLARQISLNREVALKVSVDATHEAATLANLEHDHIVRVFSESLDPQTGLRLLCMQCVPGTTLAAIIRWRNTRPPQSWSGRLLIEAVGALSNRAAPPQKAALDARELLQQSDPVESACWIGARLADALAFAHQRGVIHRDIKPANILVDHCGRPFLTDFNLSLAAGRAEGLFGGSCAYMAPEHLDAFNSRHPASPEVVDERSDIYSLGIVLYELLTGRRPFADDAGEGDREDLLEQMAAARRQGAPAPRRENPDVSLALDRIVRQCLEPDPDCRWQSAGELALALEGARELHGMEHEMPGGGRLTRIARQRPFEVVFSLVFAPHIICVALNVIYVMVALSGSFSPRQMAVYFATATGYTLLSFLGTGIVSWRLTEPKRTAWRLLHRGKETTAPVLTAARQRSVVMPVWGSVISLAGWLPGAVMFPAMLYFASDAAPLGTLLHIFLLYTLSGLIALTYTYFAAEFVDLRIGYLMFLMHESQPRHTARRELRGVDRRLRAFQLLAGAIPLFATMLVALAGPRQGDASTLVFQLLMIAVLLLSGVGFSVALLAAQTFHQTLAALTGAEGRRI